MTDKPKDARAERQARVSKVVWGLAFITAGVLITLDSRGTVVLPRETPYPAKHATDGDTATRWSSRWRDGQWLSIDLGAPAALAKVRLQWEKAYASSYDLAVSEDGQKWTTVAEVRDGDGGLDEHVLSGQARYVRLTALERAAVPEGKKKRRYGVSLWELEVLGPAGELLSRGKLATASSAESNPFGLWFLYWPVFFVLVGLPALLAPKDSSDQMMGLMFVAGGVAFELRQLGLLKLKLWEMVPLFLVLAGALLIVEALRHRNGPTRTGAAEEAQ